MSEVDHSLHMREFSPWSEIPTRYAADTADVGHDVDDAWKELGVYGKKFFVYFSWILIMKYLPTVPTDYPKQSRGNKRNEED